MISIEKNVYTWTTLSFICLFVCLVCFQYLSHSINLFKIFFNADKNRPIYILNNSNCYRNPIKHKNRVLYLFIILLCSYKYIFVFCTILFAAKPTTDDRPHNFFINLFLAMIVLLRGKGLSTILPLLSFQITNKLLNNLSFAN